MRVLDRRRLPRFGPPAVFVALLAALAVGLTACGSDDDGDSADAGGGGEAASNVVEEAKAAVEAAEAPAEEWKGPDSSPPPAKGKKVYVVGCGADVEGCVRDFDAAAEAAEAMGWDVTTLQTDGSPQGYNDAYKRALDSNVDGILSAGIPTPLIENPIKTAAKRGIPVVSMAADNDPGNVGAGFKGGLFAEVGPDQEEMGAMAGNYIVAESGGETVLGLLNDTAFPVLQKRIAGFQSAIDKCSGCEVLPQVNVPVAELAEKGAPAMLQFFRANPDVEYFFGSYDGGNIFAAQAVRQAGADEVKIVGQDASAPNLDMIREGGPQVASAGYSLELVGWAAVDQLNRAFNGEAPAKEWMPGNGGIQLRLIVESNAPPSGPYVGDLEFEDEFRKLWGV